MVVEEWFRGKSALLGGPEDITKFGNLNFAKSKEKPIRRPYSITRDILAFRRCGRQYGYFVVHGYVPAQSTQLYFGIVIHEVLDRAHRQFRGLLEMKDAGMPSDNDIEEYFHNVTEALRARGIRPYNRATEDSAMSYLKNFNSKYGPSLYPRVIDTEHKLIADMKDFYLHGVVDVLATSAGSVEELEIWDYKGSHRVEEGSEEMKNYVFQMQVYSELYHARNGRYPARAILCFIAETDESRMLKEVKFDKDMSIEAIREFAQTVSEIERRRGVDDWRPPSKMPSRETCAACDIRWDCTTAKDKFKFRYP